LLYVSSVFMRGQNPNFFAFDSAKILGRIILSERSLQTYGDIGDKAFGPRANFLISFLFCLELFCVSCVFVTLSADSIHSMFPIVSSNMYKLVGLIMSVNPHSLNPYSHILDRLLPTMFVSLRLISYASAIGILSTVFLIFVVFFDGFSKTTTPGSLYDPAPTDFVILQPMKIGAAFGLFMSGVSLTLLSIMITDIRLQSSLDIR
jgi:solute carrier family 32 (vesicular inhibitory amino acid transporter)